MGRAEKNAAGQTRPLPAASLWGKYQERLKYIAARVSQPHAPEQQVQQLAQTTAVKDLAFLDPKMIGGMTSPPPMGVAGSSPTN